MNRKSPVAILTNTDRVHGFVIGILAEFEEMEKALEHLDGINVVELGMVYSIHLKHVIKFVSDGGSDVTAPYYEPHYDVITVRVARKAPLEELIEDLREAFDTIMKIEPEIIN